MRYVKIAVIIGIIIMALTGCSQGVANYDYIYDAKITDVNETRYGSEFTVIDVNNVSCKVFLRMSGSNMDFYESVKVSLKRNPNQRYVIIYDLNNSDIYSMALMK